MEIQTPNNQQPPQEQQPNTLLKVIVLIALIVLLILGILLPIKLVPNAVSSIKDTVSGWFGGTTQVTLSTDKTEIDSGVPFTLSWTGGHKDNGSYVLSYQCEDGVHFETSINQPNEVINCNTQYYFSPNDNTISLTAFSDNNRFTDVPVTLAFLPNDSSEATSLGSILITVTNTSLADSRGALSSGSSTTTTSIPSPTATPVVTVTPTPKPTSTPTPTPVPTKTSAPTVHHTYTTSNPNGTADLSVAIIDVGYLNDNAVFIPSTGVTSDEHAAIKFRVTNKGTKNTGAWSFLATLPTASHPTYTALNQENLGPGDSIVYTLGFDQINNSTDNTITITVDPNNTIPEITYTNNTATTHIENYGASQSNTSTGTTGYTTSNTSGTTNSTSGQADLVISSIVSGYVSNQSGLFYSTHYLHEENEAAVEITVTNNGTAASGQWNYSATLPPSASNSQFTSSEEPSLAPGQAQTYLITFNNLQNQGNNTVTVTINPNNATPESNYNNNTSSVTMYRY